MRIKRKPRASASRIKPFTWRRALYNLVARTWSKVDFFSLKVCESLNNLLRITRTLNKFKKMFLILSVDTERDLYVYKTTIAGWEIGVPYILDTFSECGVDGRACWLIEYNVRDGLFPYQVYKTFAKTTFCDD